jgi:hypothetical protein
MSRSRGEIFERPKPVISDWDFRLGFPTGMRMTVQCTPPPHHHPYEESPLTSYNVYRSANADQACSHRNSSRSSHPPMVNLAITINFTAQALLGIIGIVMTVMTETGTETLCLQ